MEEGANATVTDLLLSMLEEEELGLPRVTQVRHSKQNCLEVVVEISFYAGYSFSLDGLTTFGSSAQASSQTILHST